jgi:hypothetical protein
MLTEIQRIQVLIRAGKSRAALSEIELLPDAARSYEIPRLLAIAQWGAGDTNASFLTLK